MVPYVYQPIPDTGYIRVLTLEPGAYDDDIVVHISGVPFDPACPPRYEALSYVWGSEENKMTVFVGNRGRSTVTVTKNLDVALRHLRYDHKEPRVMWIDAICIDQKNDQEKGPQVARMGQVFKCAARVLVWLGPEQNHSDLAMQLILYIGSQILVPWPPFVDGSSPWSLRPSSTAHDKSLADLDAPWPFNFFEFSAVFHLFSRKWFKRLWIRQEIYSNEGRGIVICGKSQVSWTCMRNVMAVFYIKGGHKAPQWSSTLMDGLRSLIFQSPYISLQSSIHELDSSDCKDPRDRIYAILSLLDPSTAKLDIRPDYTKPAAFVYKDATRKWIMQFGLDILKQCQFTTNISNPSWVPDWTTRLEVGRSFIYAFASSQLAGCSQFLDSDILSVAGTVVTAVGTLYDLDGAHERFYPHEFSESLRKLFIKINPNTDENKDDAVAIYAEVLYADGPNLRRGFARDNNQDLADLTRFLSRLYTNGVESAMSIFPGSRTVDLLGPIRGRLIGRRIFINSRRRHDYRGLVPKSTRSGDIVCTILGLRDPLVLRPLGNNEYKLVGVSWVTNTSSGQTLLGPLPDDIVPVYCVDKDNYVTIDFMNRVTGELGFADPRLEKFPNFKRYLEAVQNNENVLLKVHPQLLRDNGVNIQYFNLV
ncbi:putative Heterokaryon incompatibility protein-domain-containing protein [Seiridium cardinale]|uniref:Heterokaryon incompatibility protein-domain-containing protein n=1 Tax=Seiridium cardinale TaxID=138064 RepID=A0ABR2Y149_9PEZI